MNEEQTRALQLIQSILERPHMWASDRESFVAQLDVLMGVLNKGENLWGLMEFDGARFVGLDWALDDAFVEKVRAKVMEWL